MREKRSDEGEDRTMRVTHTFEDFTYWNLDLRPSVNDKIVQAMDWGEPCKSGTFIHCTWIQHLSNVSVFTKRRKR